MRTIPPALYVLALLATLPAHATTVRIHYDAGKDTIALRGDKGPMSWSKSAPLQRAGNGIWTYSWPDGMGAVTVKPILGPHTVSSGGVYRIPAGATLDIYPFFGPPLGTVKLIPDFASPQLGNKRQLRVYLPPSYSENTAKRYPVLYMHDGQNLFDAKTAAYGVEWGIDETVNHQIATGAMDEVIVVGIDNTPDRIPEYTPCCDPKYGGGKLDAYQAFITDTVKPYIDKTLRTLPGRENTAIMGSSLGGIASVVIAQRRADLFSKAGGVSSSFWWNDRQMVNAPAPKVAVKFYLDAGGDNDGLDDTLLMHDTMLKQGYTKDEDVLLYIDDAGGHNEKSWAARVARPLTWFFPWGSTRQ
ncbi:alpha/beta hydrolase [Massilia sp. CF038]|uniref:alpha/beta hydrolase n=1 Tax=Massilia sp. CF038 TaxID=1881045 RepID=UPI00091ACC0E|nr:alpha/beta hydrolase-fold protein [Massilia sp. CF038]SHG41240.1 Predicted hydrolase of the alpha/beta superfamily [Massilia sp. CF038]